MRRLAAALVGLAVLVLGAAGASAQTYGGPLEVDLGAGGHAGTVNPGGQLHLTAPAGTFAPGADVTVTLHSDPVVLGTFPAADDGSFDVTVTVPEDVDTGEHSLVAEGPGPDGDTVTVQADLTVDDLAFTGSEGTGGLLVGAGALILVGAAAAVWATRRRTV